MILIEAEAWCPGACPEVVEGFTSRFGTLTWAGTLPALGHRAEAADGIWRGYEDMKAGNTRPGAGFLADLRCGFSRAIEYP